MLGLKKLKLGRIIYLALALGLAFPVIGDPVSVKAVSTWQGEYWNLDSPTDKPEFPETSADLTRTDNQVSFYWDSGSPDDSINYDGFMARWTSTQTFDNGYYQFTTTSDDGVRVYLDGTKIIDNWLTGANWGGIAAADLVAGSHEITVEYYENTSNASIVFAYEKVAIADGLTTTEITDCNGLQAMANNLTGNYRLANNIDCSDTAAWNGGEGFVPVGDMDNYFQGTLDGNDKAISNLTINRPDSGLPIGLFGAAGGSSMVQDLYIANATITGATNVGILAGYLAGTAVGVHSSGLVTGAFPPVAGNYGIGGLVGTHAAEPGPSYTIIGSSSSADVNAADAEESYAGGLVGQNLNKDILLSYASGHVENLATTGGLVGYSNLAVISGSHATGSVTGCSGTGGLVGYSDDDTISDSYASGAVISNCGYAGGLIGQVELSDIKQVSATGSVSGTTAGSIDRMGGLIGEVTSSSISYAFATGNVNISGDVFAGETGGLIGVATGSPLNINHVYATGNVTVATSATYGDSGGLIGSLTGAYNISNAYATGDVTMTGTAPGALSLIGNGGLIGFATGNVGSSIDQTYAAGNVTNGNYAGGLIGSVYSSQGLTISNSYARGNVSGSESVSSFIGGVALTNAATLLEVSTSYGTGLLTPISGASAGGAYGFVDVSGIGAAFYSYDVFWDEDTSGISDLNDYSFGYPTIDMKNIRNFIDTAYNANIADGYDFTGTQYDDGSNSDYWAIDGTTNDGYPYLGMDMSFDFSWFANGDSDVAVDDVEDAGQNGGDANDDGIQDRLQGFVTGFENHVSNGSSVLEVVGDCTILDVGSASESTQINEDSGYSYPEGLMSFSVECPEDGEGNSQTVTVTQYFYGLSSDNVVARKYNSDTGAYSTIEGAVISEEIIDGQTVTKITYQVTDGLELDEDGAYNGIIIDPSGPGLNVVGAPNTGLKKL